MDQQTFKSIEKIVDKPKQSVLSRQVFQKLVEENKEDFPESIDQMTELIRLHYAQR